MISSTRSFFGKALNLAACQVCHLAKKKRPEDEALQNGCRVEFPIIKAEKGRTTQEIFEMFELTSKMTFKVVSKQSNRIIPGFLLANHRGRWSRLCECKGQLLAIHLWNLEFLRSGQRWKYQPCAVWCKECEFGVFSYSCCDYYCCCYYITTIVILSIITATYDRLYYYSPRAKLMIAALQYVSNIELDKDPMHKCAGVTEKGLVLLVGPAPGLTHSFPKELQAHFLKC